MPTAEEVAVIQSGGRWFTNPGVCTAHERERQARERVCVCVWVVVGGVGGCWGERARLPLQASPPLASAAPPAPLRCHPRAAANTPSPASGLCLSLFGLTILVRPPRQSDGVGKSLQNHVCTRSPLLKTTALRGRELAFGDPFQDSGVAAQGFVSFYLI